MFSYCPSCARTCKLLVTSLSIAASACSRSCWRCGRSSSSMLACRADKACCRICCCCCCSSCCNVTPSICTSRATLDHWIVCLPAELPTAAADTADAPVALSQHLGCNSRRTTATSLGQLLCLQRTCGNTGIHKCRQAGCNSSRTEGRSTGRRFCLQRTCDCKRACCVSSCCRSSARRVSELRCSSCSTASLLIF